MYGRQSNSRKKKTNRRHAMCHAGQSCELFRSTNLFRLINWPLFALVKLIQDPQYTYRVQISVWTLATKVIYSTLIILLAWQEPSQWFRDETESSRTSEPQIISSSERSVPALIGRRAPQARVDERPTCDHWSHACTNLITQTRCTEWSYRHVHSAQIINWNHRQVLIT